MKKRIKKYIKEIIIFIVLLIVLSNVMSFYKSTDLNKSPLKLKTVKLIRNQNYTIDNSKPIMVHFWATWCPICKIEASNIQTISENFQVLSVAVQSGSDNEIENYQKENNVSFMVINDKDGSLSKQIGINVFPTTIIYNKNGNISFVDIGYTSTWTLWLKMFWADL